jgi:hypothetical protein
VGDPPLFKPTKGGGKWALDGAATMVAQEASMPNFEMMLAQRLTIVVPVVRKARGEIRT